MSSREEANPLRARDGAPAWPGAVAVGLAVAAVLGYAASILSYLYHPGFTEHLEPAIACISSRFYDGLSIFPVDPHDPPGGMQYGPTTYAAIGLWMAAIDDPIFAAKLACGFAAALSVAFVTLAFLREASRKIAAVFAGCLSAWLLLFAQSPYMVTPVAWILLALGAGVFCAGLERARVSALLVGALTGAAVGCKLQAGLPFLPLLGLIWHRQRWRGLILAGITGGLVAAGPFAFPSISLEGFLRGLSFAGAHGFTFFGFGKTATTALWMVAPTAFLFVAACLSDREIAFREAGRRWAYWAGLAAAMFLAMALSLKKGAGVGHLTPFPPILAHAALRMFLVFEATGATRRWRPRLVAAAMLVYAIALFPAALRAQLPVWKAQEGFSSDLEMVRRDLFDVLEALPGRRIAVGMGDLNGYLATFTRPVLVAEGHPYLVEPVGLMDAQAAGVELFPAKILSPSEIDVWLIPLRSQPFSMGNYYGTGPVFSPVFQKSFLEGWRRAGTSRAFDIWVPR